MSPWAFVVSALLPPFAVAVFSAGRGSLPMRLLALQLATAFAIMMLIMLTFFLDQSSFIDLALALALLSLPGSLLAALFVERWL